MKIIKIYLPFAVAELIRANEKNVVLTATLDGSLHGIDRKNGRILWTNQESEAMIKCTFTAKEHDQDHANANANLNNLNIKALPALDESQLNNPLNLYTKSANTLQDIIFIPEPSGDGDLYYLDKSTAQMAKFKISLKEIVSDGLGVKEGQFIFTGGKSTSVLAIDPFTGHVIRSFGSNAAGAKNTPSEIAKCQGGSAVDAFFKCKASEYRDSSRDVVYLAKTSYHLQIHSLVNEKISWNISYFEYKPTSSATMKKSPSSVKADVYGNFKLNPHPGQDQGIFMFQTEFNTPVLQVFDVIDDRVEGPSIYSATNHLVAKNINAATHSFSQEKGEIAYIGNREGTFYFLSDHYFPFLEKRVDRHVEGVEECLLLPDNSQAQIECLVGTYILKKRRPDTGFIKTLDPVMDEKAVDVPSVPLPLRLFVGAMDGFFKEAARLLVTLAFVLLLFLGVVRHRGIVYFERFFPALFGWEVDNAVEIKEDADKSSEPTISTNDEGDLVADLIATTKTTEMKPPSSASSSLQRSSIPSTSNTGLQYIQVSEKVLGYGSHGTLVLQGTFEGRPVAIKRMLTDFFSVADHEVKILQDSDIHPNIVRYYFKEECEGFMYIALEKCAGSLQQFVDGHDVPELNALRTHVSLKQMVGQIANGLAYLHSLNIAHRDIKPQNILVSSFKKGEEMPRLLISDFGLGKRLDDGQSSFHHTIGASLAGTVGWRAPESLLAYKGAAIKSADDSGGDEREERGWNDSKGRSQSSEKHHTLRITKAIDIFSAGCVFYYLLTQGGHPFGDKFSRENNIVKGNFQLNHKGESEDSLLKLITRMISRDPQKRPSADMVQRNCYFWSASKQLMFLQDLSDRLEKETRDPASSLLKLLERQSVKIVGRSWIVRVKGALLEDMQKFRKYEGNSLQDLLRVIRNKKHHYQELSPALKKEVGALPDGFLDYFTSRFPSLVVTTVNLVEQNRQLFADSMLDQYFINAAEQL